jgi:hypothetical protein
MLGQRSCSAACVGFASCSIVGVLKCCEVSPESTAAFLIIAPPGVNQKVVLQLSEQKALGLEVKTRAPSSAYATTLISFCLSTLTPTHPIHFTNHCNMEAACGQEILLDHQKASGL